MERQPLAVEATLGQMIEAELVDLAGVERRRARRPGKEELGEDHVVARPRREEKAPAVVDEESRSRLLEEVAVLGREQRGRIEHLSHQLDAVGLQPWNGDRGAERITRSDADREQAARCAVEQQRDECLPALEQQARRPANRVVAVHAQAFLSLRVGRHHDARRCAVAIEDGALAA